eukprot:6779214-Prymnesium_polylepis.1
MKAARPHTRDRDARASGARANTGTRTRQCARGKARTCSGSSWCPPVPRAHPSPPQRPRCCSWRARCSSAHALHSCARQQRQQRRASDAFDHPWRSDGGGDRWAARAGWWAAVATVGPSGKIKGGCKRSRGGSLLQACHVAA